MTQIDLCLMFIKMLPQHELDSLTISKSNRTKCCRNILIDLGLSKSNFGFATHRFILDILPGITDTEIFQMIVLYRL